MYIPDLKKSSRSREYNNYSYNQRADAVIAYLFKGMSHRRIDVEVLKVDMEDSRGYQAMGILHHIGLVNAHKGLFVDLTLKDAVDELKRTDPIQFAEIIDILSSKI